MPGDNGKQKMSAPSSQVEEVPSAKNWSVTFFQLDVGQGEAAFGGFINRDTPSESVFFMIDGGRDYTKPEIRKCFSSFVGKIKSDHPDKPNIPTKLHAIFKGSKDDDHSKGLPAINDTQLVNAETRFFSYEDSPPYGRCVIGQNIWQLLGKERPLEAPNLDVVSSAGEYQGRTRTLKGNNNDKSLGFLITYHDFSFFTAGDLSSGVEDHIPFGKEVSVVKAGHHGSQTSTSKSLLDKLKPRTLLVSHGANYFHPHQNTLNRVEKSSVKFNYMTNPAAYTRGADYLEKHPKVVVAGDGNHVTAGKGKSDIKEKGFGKEDKDPKGHISILVTQAQAKKGEYTIAYERRPPNAIIGGKLHATRSKDKRTRSVKDKYKAVSFDEKNAELQRSLRKEHESLSWKTEYELDVSDTALSDFEEENLKQKHVTCKFKSSDGEKTVDRISVRIYDKLTPETKVLSAKKRYFRDKVHSEKTVSRTQENYR